ncbi:MAG: MoxR family ATPase [Dethiobacteria bacterium]
MEQKSAGAGKGGMWDDESDLLWGQRKIKEISAAVGTVFRGKHEIMERLLVGIISKGHILLDDVPGVGKTTLVKALALACGCSFKRIQFTPDLMPADVTGTYVFNQKSGEFEFRAGPIFAQFVLADEINRASPKTQSSMLEAMEETGVTIDGQTRRLPQPFIVLATQNPLEYEGTFPLPEAQMDRFFLCTSLDYPDPPVEIEIMDEIQIIKEGLENMKPVTGPDELLELYRISRRVNIEYSLKEYIVEIMNLSRQRKELDLGGSPRGSLFLAQAARVRALMEGRDYVIPDDIKMMAVPVLAHRLVLSPQARFSNIRSEDVVYQILEEVNIPI